jgi:glycerol-3-phosphate acyltransferase PlsY
MKIYFTKHSAERLTERFGVDIDPTTDYSITKYKKTADYRQHGSDDMLTNVVTKVGRKTAVLVVAKQTGAVITVVGPHRSPMFDYAVATAA